MVEKVGKLNTYYTDADGMVLYYDEKGEPNMGAAKIGIRFTSDDRETLSIQAGNVQITAPFEAVEDVVKAARENRKAA